jgi:hypothetical protein
MRIKGAKSISEYKEKEKEAIQAWVDRNFVEGAVKWEMDGANAVKITDGTGDTMIVPLSEIN